jgi:hypothetical protein
LWILDLSDGGAERLALSRTLILLSPKLYEANSTAGFQPFVAWQALLHPRNTSAGTAAKKLTL